ncbi:Sodium/calcium exchanger domain containing protein [Elaphomyces granulatus]
MNDSTRQRPKNNVNRPERAMSSIALKDRSTALDEGQPRPAGLPSEKRWELLQGLNEASHAVKATLFSSWLNLFLGLVPLGIVAGSLGWNSATVFILNFLAIFPLAGLLSFATEQLSASVGPTIGGLINATFGNAVEMIVGITALSQGEIRIVQSSMVGSVLSGTLLVLGCCFFAAGYGRDTVKFNVGITGIMSSLMIVSTASLLIPSALFATTTVSDSRALSQEIADLSHVTSIILLLFYLTYLYFQLKSHAHLFTDDEADEAESPELGPWAASAVLIMATLGVTVCSDHVVETVDGVVEACNVSRAFIGLIVVPIIGNAGEFTSTVSAAKKGKLDLAIGMVVGSTLQIALFVTPFLVILGWIMGQPMTLHFNTFELAVFSLAVIVVNCLIRDGRTNYFEGILLIGTYTIIAIGFYVHPDVRDP